MVSAAGVKFVNVCVTIATARQWNLYFGVKFYVHSPDILKQDVTR